MQKFHQEMLESLMKDKSPEFLHDYIVELEQRTLDMEDWIKYLKVLYKKKTRKPVDTGARDGR